MYRMNKLYEKHTLLIIVSFLFCLRISNVRAELKTEFISHNKYFDVTTIYRIANESALNNTGDHDGYSIEIHSRTDSIGLPVENNYTISKKNVNELFNNRFVTTNAYITPYTEQITVRSDGTICSKGNDGIQLYAVTNVTTIGTANQDTYYPALGYQNELDTGGILNDSNDRTFLTLNWTPVEEQTCLTITYIHELTSSVNYNNIEITIADGYSDEIANVQLENGKEIRTLRITDMALKKNTEYNLTIVFKRDEHYKHNHLRGSFALLRIAHCPNQDEEDVSVISPHPLVRDSLFTEPIPFGVFGSAEQSDFKRSVNCLNGGLTLGLDSKCICPSGFKGEFCETGCGPNLYGRDCTGVCSMNPSKQCRGMLMCTKSHGCACPAGLTGRFCNEDCKSDKYGVDCRQTCSSTCYNSTCDQYTGLCTRGCSNGYVPPYCREKYPYILEPPAEISVTNDTIVIQLNFQPYNICGDKNLTLMLYRLIYKASNEDRFSNSELKIISRNKYIYNETIRDLIPDTAYQIGVLVITQDGNFNYQDIVYGQYRTLCIQPQITDYNVQLIPEVKSVNITWNKIIAKNFECKVHEYELTLTLNQSRNVISGIQKIISSSDSGHVIDDLYPGYQYSITMTPKTSKGSLKESPAYSFVPFMPVDDVIINDIVTTVEYNIIDVSWKLGSSVYPHGSVVKNPVTCVVRYKLNRIFSCSQKEIENSNWTSIEIYNRTNYKIYNTVPNSQYYIQVYVSNNKSKNITHRENMAFLYIPPSNPQTKPEIDVYHPISVTNNSVNVQWNADTINCTKLNGFLMKYYIELKDTSSNILQISETKQKYISFDNLNSNTSYEMKVFIKTHFGYNPEQFLFYNFTTKPENLKPVDDLMVYKKSVKSRMVGLRWSFLSANTNLNGFLVSFNENLTNDLVVPPTKCSAWPEYYCHTFKKLKFMIYQGKTYTFNIQAVTSDFPNGGPVSSISFKGNYGLPDTPLNFKPYAVDNTTITLQWDIPWMFNGELDLFVINGEGSSFLEYENTYDSYGSIEILIEKELPTYYYTVEGLKPGSTYSFRLSASTKHDRYSSPANITVTTHG